MKLNERGDSSRFLWIVFTSKQLQHPEDHAQSQITFNKMMIEFKKIRGTVGRD